MFDDGGYSRIVQVSYPQAFFPSANADRHDEVLFSPRDIVLVSKLPHIEHISLRHCGCGNEGITELRRARSLKSIGITESTLTDAGLEWVHGLDLYSLYLSETNVTGKFLRRVSDCGSLLALNLPNNPRLSEGSEYLGRLVHLKYFEAPGTAINDSWLKELAKLAALRRVDVSNTRVSDKGIAYLQGSMIEELFARETGISDESGNYLRRMDGLRVLGLDKTDITDRCLVELAGLRKLRILSLSHTRVSDDSIRYLRHLTNLEFLDVSNTRMSIDGAEALRQLLPSLKVNAWLDQGPAPSHH